jgi:hypothetical protein
MTLTEYEESVLAELETQFQPAPPTSRRDLGRLALPLIGLLGGVALLVAAPNVGLVHRISDLFGFTTSSVTTALSLAGHVALLGSAFLLGRALYHVPDWSAGTGTRTTEVSRERVQSP